MINPVGLNYYFLKPRGVRLVDNSRSATILGNIDTSHFCTLGSPVVDEVVAVYLYQEEALDINDLADNGGSETEQPYASTTVAYNGGNYYYEIGFVASGQCTFAFSCSTEDDPEDDDAITFEQKQESSVRSEDQDVNFTFTN